MREVARNNHAYLLTQRACRTHSISDLKTTLRFTGSSNPGTLVC